MRNSIAIVLSAWNSVVIFSICNVFLGYIWSIDSCIFKLLIDIPLMAFVFPASYHGILTSISTIESWLKKR